MPVRIEFAGVIDVIREDGRLVPRLFAADAISNELRDAAAGGKVQYVVVTRVDGLVIGHNMPDPNLAKRLAAMSAAIVGTAIITTSELSRGRFLAASLETTEGHIVCLSAGDQAIVAGLAPKEVDLNVMTRVLRGLAGEVAEAIESWDSR
jgi:predicted regulator of Ras-like GTPase activity (Roadblock/LC7/MglB family)